MKKQALAFSVAMALASGVGATTIDGITFEAGAYFDTGVVWESVLTDVSDTLSGIGYVSEMRTTDGSGVTWTTGDNNRQLTFQFGGYAVDGYYTSTDGWLYNGDVNFGNNFGQALSIQFTSGWINFYSDNTVTGTLLDPTNSTGMAEDISDAIDGNEWLNLTGHAAALVFGPSTMYGTLAAQTDGSSIHAGGTGKGYLDVDMAGAGLANGNFDTNSWDLGQFGIADVRLDSTYSTPNSNNWPLSGTASIKGERVPEPSSVALLGLGLLGMGAGVAKRRKQKHAV